MKVFVIFCENNSDKQQIEIDEYNDVNNIKVIVENLKLTNEKYTEDYFHIFHENIILNNEAIVNYYAIQPNDMIYIGKIEDYLKIDDVIVELFVIGWSWSFEYVIVKRNDSITQLKLLISRMIPECFTIHDCVGFERKDHEIITDIDLVNGYYKLIIRCRGINYEVSDCLNFHDRFLLSSYAEKRKLSLWFQDSYGDSDKLKLKEKLMKLRNLLTNEKIIPKMNEILSKIPLSLVQSRFLFCTNTADEIWNICNDYWSNVFGPHKQSIDRFICKMFQVELDRKLFFYSIYECHLAKVINSILKSDGWNLEEFTDNIRKSIMQYMEKYEQMMNNDIYKSLENPNISQDSINRITEEIIKYFQIKYISNSKHFLNLENFIKKEFIDKFKQTLLTLLIDDEGESKAKKTKLSIELGFINDQFNQIIEKSITRILDVIQSYISRTEIFGKYFEDAIKQNINFLLTTYLNAIKNHYDAILSRSDEVNGYHVWKENSIDEILTESIRQMIKSMSNHEINKESGSFTNEKEMNNNDDEIIQDEILIKKIVNDTLKENLFRSLPDDLKFKVIMRDEINRLISQSRSEFTHQNFISESMKTIDSEFTCVKIMQKSLGQIFNSLHFNDNIVEIINEINRVNNLSLSNEFQRKQNYVNNTSKQNIIYSMIRVERFKIMINEVEKLIRQQSNEVQNACKEKKIINDSMKSVVESALENLKIEIMKSQRSLRSIVITALNTFINSLNDVYENPSYFMKFIHPFLLSIQSDSDIDKILTGVSEKDFACIKMKMNDCNISLQIPLCQIKTNIQLKKSISEKTKIPVKQLLLVKLGENKILIDEGNIGSIFYYLIEFISSAKNIKVLKKLENESYLCEDRLSQKQFILKKLIDKSGNLSRDIVVHLQLQFSKTFTRFYRVYDYEGSISVGMEYSPEESLAELINKEKRLSETVIGKYCHQILIQLNEIHQERIIHRDIKCGNVVLDKDKNARIINFDFSRYKEELTNEDLFSILNTTPLGTTFNIPPQFLLCERNSEKIDIWLFGMMVFEMLTGKIHPHNHDLVQKIVKITSPVAIKFDLPKNTSKELDQFVNSCLNNNPDERPNAKQLLESDFIKKYNNKQNL